MNENEATDNTAEPAFGDAPPQARTLLSNKRYDQLKFLAQILLPALATFYASFGEIWSFPKTEEVVASIIALDLFLGILLGLSTRQYEYSGAKYAGVVHLKDTVLEDGETRAKQVGIGFKDGVDGQTMETKKEVTFKVISE